MQKLTNVKVPYYTAQNQSKSRVIFFFFFREKYMIYNLYYNAIIAVRQNITLWYPLITIYVFVLFILQRVIIAFAKISIKYKHVTNLLNRQDVQ